MCSLEYAARPVTWWTQPSVQAFGPAPRFFSRIRRKRGDCLRGYAEPGDAILFKGSRGVHVERALESFYFHRMRAGDACSTGCSTKSCFTSTRRSACFNTRRFAPRWRASPRCCFRIVLGPWLIARLRQFQIGQHIREDGPQSHQKKAGTPTMGGLLICFSIVVPTLLWANLSTPAVWVALLGLVSFGAIGFWDDYTKMMRKRNLGLTARQKLGLQVVAAMLIGVVLLAMNARGLYSTSMNVPFFKNFKPDLLIHALAAQSADLSAGVRVFLRVSDSGVWWARRTP